MKQELVDWVTSRDTGLSSLTIFEFFTGQPLRRPSTPDYPERYPVAVIAEGIYSVVPPYSSERRWTAEVEAEIARRGLHCRYADELLSLLWDRTIFEGATRSAQLWAIATASPELRCLAALAAVRGGG